ncbi:MAG: nucleotide exchange factor GrpE [candidate division WOR-3 bacterium]|nr:nucleotide exchange factor GrpE [candidate division WOR-3 bacterium]MCX7757752.1 nucleotide exchange factor GrpE [candidate division WOR-3 bacterium]MDW7988037.1 nucleotide exchange factor GrpE [candidate division WOR-3 bacterium]
MGISKKGPVTELKENYQKLLCELKTCKDTLLRALADFENYRKRKEKEFCEFQEYANENLLSELIPALENFERAFSFAKLSNPNDNLLKGIEIAYRQLQGVLEKFGLKEYSCLDQPYDPKLAEVVGCVENPEKPNNIVIEELNRGYQYRDKILRPARVIVTKNSFEEPKNTENSQAKECDNE